VLRADAPVVLRLYQQERAHLVVVCRVALSAGVEERRVRLAEAQGEQIVGLLRAVRDAAELALSDAQRLVFDRLAVGGLRQLTAG